jgi:hypothetical protein
MVNLIAGVSIRRPSKLINVTGTLWERCTVDSEITQSSLSIIRSCKLSFPIVGLPMSFLPTLILNFPDKIFIQ